jgi:hypothetical protein
MCKLEIRNKALAAVNGLLNPQVPLFTILRTVLYNIGIVCGEGEISLRQNTIKTLKDKVVSTSPALILGPDLSARAEVMAPSIHLLNTLRLLVALITETCTKASVVAIIKRQTET